jgi:hypothetical protein
MSTGCAQSHLGFMYAAVAVLMSRAHRWSRRLERYLLDSRRPELRFLGAVKARGTLGRRARHWLQIPIEAGLPVVGPLLAAVDRRAAARRQSLLEAAGRPLVSVVMAAHDAQDTVVAAVASLLAQSHANLEVVVVDDASRDATLDRLAGIDDPRVRIVRRSTQGGAAAARNRGLQVARGAFLTFQDADDLAHPQRIECQLAGLLAVPGSAVCVCDGQRLDGDGNPVTVNGRYTMKWVNSMMFPRRVLERIGYQRSSLHVSEDSEYYERIKLVFGPEHEVRLLRTLYFARFAPDSLLFSDGEVAVSGQRVVHRRSVEAERAWDEVTAWHRRVDAGELDPYVPCE